MEKQPFQKGGNQPISCVINTICWRWWFEIVSIFHLKTWGRWTHFDSYVLKLGGSNTTQKALWRYIYLDCTQLAMSGQGMSLSRTWGEIRWTRSSKSTSLGPSFRCFYCIWLQVISSSVVKQWQKLHMKHSNDTYEEDHGGIQEFWYWSVNMFVFFSSGNQVQHQHIEWLQPITTCFCLKLLVFLDLSLPKTQWKKEHWSLFW